MTEGSLSGICQARSQRSDSQSLQAHPNPRSAHLRDVPSLGRRAVVHTLDNVPPVRAAVEDARRLVWVARVEAAKGDGRGSLVSGLKARE